MKRKVLAMFLATTMAVGVMAGCGGGETASTDTSTTDESTTDESAEETTDEASEETAEEGSEEVADVNEDGTVNNPEAVEVDPNKLVFWSLFSGGDGEFMDQIIADYNAGSPKKEVQSIMLVWADYYTKLQTAVAAGKGPDVGVSHVSKLPELVDQGVVVPLNDYLDELGYDLSTMFSANSMDSVTFDGEIYAVPLDTHAEIIYYNLDILEKAGVELNAEGQLDIQSKDDFFAICDKIKAVMGDGETVIALTNKGDDPYRLWWATYFQMGGTPLVNDDCTEVTLDTDIAVEAAEFVKSLYDNGYVLEGIEDHQSFFQSGAAAIYTGGTWATGALEKTENLNFGAQPWPKLFNDDSCWADSHTLILPFSKERTEEETLAAVDFLVKASTEGGTTWAGSGQIPSATAVLESDEYAAMPYRSSYKSALDTAVMPSKSATFYAMKAGMIESLDTYWTGASDAATAIDSLYSELESNLE